MNKRQDSDIFGTKNEVIIPRIKNDEYINPNACFQNKTNQNYENYKLKLSNGKFKNKQTLSLCKVMEKASFDQCYHHHRKDLDLQSSIFYQPTIVNNSINRNKRFSQSEINKDKIEGQKYFGKKQTMNRQIKNLPENLELITGNKSKLFGISQRIQQKEKNCQLIPLLPPQINWDQYDSVKYQGNNHNRAILHIQKPLNNINESQSTLFEEQKKEKLNSKDKQVKGIKITKKESQREKQNCNIGNIQIKNKNYVEIKIINGWNIKYLQGLTKQCRINGTKLLKYQFQQGKQGIIILEKIKKWQNVTDWIRRQTKTKIRMSNN